MDDPIINEFLEKVGELACKIHAIYIFGSRAKGTHRPDSDYDFLLIVSEPFSLANKDALYEIVMDVLLSTGRLISLKIFKEDEFQRLCKMKTPFTTHVITEGLKVG